LTLGRIFRSFIFHLGFESQNPRKQEQSWQNKPTDQFTGSQSSSSTGFNTQNPQGFISQPQSQQSQQTFTEIAPSTQTTFRLEGLFDLRQTLPKFYLSFRF
jgi:hypothetical protein